MRILIVEPDKILGRTYKKALEPFCEVVLANSALDAINRADHATPDLILLEPYMARHNGMEFLYELKSYHEWSKVQIIILSSGDISGDYKTASSDLRIIKSLQKSQTSLEEIVEEVKRVAAIESRA